MAARTVRLIRSVDAVPTSTRRAGDLFDDVRDLGGLRELMPKEIVREERIGQVENLVKSDLFSR